MKKETLFVEMSDGVKVALHTWIPEGDIKAVVQLSHGMAEYSMRYDALGDFLASNGIAFYAHDHRGHGETAGSVEKLGYLADKDGFFKVVSDVRELIKKAHADFPGKKVFLLGHSFGSFVSQNFIENYGNEIDGVILCGSAGPRLGLTGMAEFLAKTVTFFKGPKSPAHFINGVAFGSYNKRIPGATSEFAWLSRVDEEVKKYEDSPLCGFLCTNGFFRDFFGGFNNIHKASNMKKIPAGLPVFLIAGDEDPVGNYGKSVKDLFGIYKKNGIKDLDMKLYPGARHELFNETCREEVRADVLGWLNARI